MSPVAIAVSPCSEIRSVAAVRSAKKGAARWLGGRFTQSDTSRPNVTLNDRFTWSLRDVSKERMPLSRAAYPTSHLRREQ